VLNDINTVYIHYDIIDEKGSKHSFILNELMAGNCKWFIPNRFLMTEKTIELEKHYKYHSPYSIY
jgi:hypothetical protein